MNASLELRAIGCLSYKRRVYISEKIPLRIGSDTKRSPNASRLREAPLILIVS